MKSLCLVILLLSPFLRISEFQKGATVNPVTSEFKLIVPKAGWEQIFFEAINERTRIANLRSLRVALPKDDLELRVWNGFGLTALEGFVLQRRGGKWSAVHLEGIHSGLPKR